MATVFDRISTIIRANINDMLDSAEDPEAMLNQIIRDMNEALRQADSDIADQIAQQKMLEGDLDASTHSQKQWQSKAELAVNKSRDDLAREALLRVNDYTEQSSIYSKQLEGQKQAVTELKSKRDQLKSKYDQALRNRDNLVARARAAQAKSKITQVGVQAHSTDYASELERFERKIRHQEARADADEEVAETKTTVEDEFNQLGANDQVDAQLAELKTKLGK